MRLIELRSASCTPVREFSSAGAESVEVVAGQGEAHCHVVRLEAGGSIGLHEAGFGQLFVVLSGTAWVSGVDGQREPVAAGQAMLLERGEIHAKGATEPVVALIVQVRDLALPAAAETS